MNAPNSTTPDTGVLISLLIKAWIIGILAFSLLLALIFVFEIDYSLPTSTPLKVVVTYVMATLFLLLSTTLFSFPLMVIAGMTAYVLHTPIAKHPNIAAATWTLGGFVLYRVALHTLGGVTDTGLFDWIFGYAITREGIATLITLAVSSLYFCRHLGNHITANSAG